VTRVRADFLRFDRENATFPRVMTGPRQRFALPLAVVLACAGCWVPIEQGKAMEADLVKLKSAAATTDQGVKDLELRAARDREKTRTEADAQAKRIDAKLAEVDSRIDALNRTAHKTGADLGVEIENALTEVARLRGLVEKFEARAAAAEAAAQALRDELTARLATIESKGKQADDAERITRARQEAEKAEAERKAAEIPADKQAFYDLAKKKLDDGEVARARELFTTFLSKWRDDALAPNAQYWIAETLYKEQKFKDAIFEFRKVWEGWPRSDKAPDAVFKIALSFQGLDDDANAQLFLNEVASSYPKSGAAKLAKERLADLSKKK